MSDPRRWLDEEGGATRHERELLRAGLAMDPPDGAQDRVWAALLPQLGGPSGPPDGDGPGGLPHDLGPAGVSTAGGAAAAAGKAAGAFALSGLVKAMLVGGAGAALFVAGYAAVTPAVPPPSPPVGLEAQAQAARGHVEPPPAPRAPGLTAEDRANAPSPEAAKATPAAPRDERVAGVEPSSPGAAAPPVEPSPPGAAAERTTRLREERRMLEEARDTLRRGDASGALQKLDQARIRFPGGVLVQEREALGIEALHSSGQRAAASARAAAFLRAYPQSPHATRMQSFLQ
jgi:hypothetical protein